jgi:hypothetical protein
LTEASESFERRQKQRLAVLKHMYNTAAGQGGDLRGAWFEADDIAKELPYSERDIVAALSYLEGKRLVGIVAQDFDSTTYSLTHIGIEEIERSLAAPERGTEHFAPQVTHHFYGTVGTVQTGSHATANVTQNIGTDLFSVFALIEQLRQQTNELTEGKQDEARDTLDVLEAELKGGRDPKRIRATLRGLASFGQGTVAFASQVATLTNQVKDLLGTTPT